MKENKLINRIKNLSYLQKFIILFAAVLLLIGIAVLVINLTFGESFDRWYGFIIAIALIICVVFGQFAATRQGYYTDLIFDYIIFAVPYAFVSGIIYYAVFNRGGLGIGVLGALIGAVGGLLVAKFVYMDTASKLSFLPAIARKIIYSVLFALPFVFLGGLAETTLRDIYVFEFGLYGCLAGGVIGTVLGFFILSSFTNHPNVSLFQMVDLAGTFFLLGQGIGRIGCYFGQCCYGISVDFDLFPFSYYVHGALHLGNPFIEAIWCIAGFVPIAVFYLGKRKNFVGFHISLYCIWYGLGRFVLEFFRAPEQKLTVFGDFGISQLVSLLMITFGLAWIAVYFIRVAHSGKKPLFFVPKDKLGDEYFGYEKTIYSHPQVTPDGKKIEENVCEDCEKV